jgi:transcriptional regulator GlxA family with amidase domain
MHEPQYEQVADMASTCITQRLFAFCPLPELALLAFSSAIAASRQANAVLSRDACTRKVVTTSRGEVRTSCGVFLKSDTTLAMVRRSEVIRR